MVIKNETELLNLFHENKKESADCILKIENNLVGKVLLLKLEYVYVIEDCLDKKDIGKVYIKGREVGTNRSYSFLFSDLKIGSKITFEVIERTQYVCIGYDKNLKSFKFETYNPEYYNFYKCNVWILKNDGSRKLYKKIDNR